MILSENIIHKPEGTELTPSYIRTQLAEHPEILNVSNLETLESRIELFNTAYNTKILDYKPRFTYFNTINVIFKVFNGLIMISPITTKIDYLILVSAGTDNYDDINIILRIGDTTRCANIRIEHERVEDTMSEFSNTLETLVFSRKDETLLSSIELDPTAGSKSYVKYLKDHPFITVECSMLPETYTSTHFDNMTSVYLAYQYLIINDYVNEDTNDDITEDIFINIIWESLNTELKISLFYANVLRDKLYQSFNSDDIKYSLLDDTVARFKGAIWFDKIRESTIMLAGLGGIGSYVAFLLARLKPDKIFLFDDDKIEAVNMSGQMFGPSQINKYKVNAAADNINMFAPTDHVYALTERIDENTPGNKIMISGFDSITARKIYFDIWLKVVESLPQEEKKECIFIDGRLAAEDFQILCVRGDDTFNIHRYVREYIFDPSEAAHTICSYKQTSHIAAIIAGMMVNLFTNFITSTIEEDIRELPFFTEYNASTVVLNTQL